MKLKILIIGTVSLLAIYLAGPAPRRPEYSRAMPATPSGGQALQDYVNHKELQHRIKPDNQARIIWFNDSLKNKSKDELEKIVEEKSKERGMVQKQIETTNTQREIYIANERKKNAVKNNNATLETEVEKIIREQAKRYRMNIQ